MALCNTNGQWPNREHYRLRAAYGYFQETMEIEDVLRFVSVIVHDARQGWPAQLQHAWSKDTKIKPN